MTAVIARHTIFNVIVCTDSVDPEVIVAEAESLAPCGTRDGWILYTADDPEPRNRPVPCDDDPTRTHYLLEA